MNVLLAILLDTWRQSRQQLVFVALILLQLLILGIGVALPRLREVDGETQFGIAFMAEPLPLARQWETIYAVTLMVNEGRNVKLGPDLDVSEVMPRVREETRHIPPLRRSIEFWCYMVCTVSFMISMWLFIAACSSYFPQMLAAGAIDLVVSRPTARWRIYLGKYLGGLALFLLAISGAHAGLFVGLGLRFDVWVSGLFLVIPGQLFAAALLYAMLALLGLLTRSTGLTILVGFAFYSVVDTVISQLLSFQDAGSFEQYPRFDAIVDQMGYLIPSFSFLQDNAVRSVLNVPQMSLVPLAVAGVWLLISLAAGVFIFSRRDF